MSPYTSKSHPGSEISTRTLFALIVIHGQLMLYTSLQRCEIEANDSSGTVRVTF